MFDDASPRRDRRVFARRPVHNRHPYSHPLSEKPPSKTGGQLERILRLRPLCCTWKRRRHHTLHSVSATARTSNPKTGMPSRLMTVDCRLRVVHAHGAIRSVVASHQRMSSDRFERWIFGAPHRLVNLLYRPRDRGCGSGRRPRRRARTRSWRGVGRSGLGPGDGLGESAWC
jgi:hypothetical protein